MLPAAAASSAPCISEKEGGEGRNEDECVGGRKGRGKKREEEVSQADLSPWKNRARQSSSRSCCCQTSSPDCAVRCPALAQSVRHRKQEDGWQAGKTAWKCLFKEMHTIMPPGPSFPPLSPSPPSLCSVPPLPILVLLYPSHPCTLKTEHAQ